MKKIAILLSLIVFCLAQNNPRNNQSAVFEQLSVVPQQNIVIDIEHSQLHNDSFISLSEYLKENKDNIFNSQNSDSNYDELLDMQNQGLSRNKPTNWNMQNAIQSIDNDSKEIDSNDIPQSLKKLAGDDVKIIPTGSYPSLDVAESNGELYVVFNYVNTAYSEYKMFYIYKSSDDGKTWDYVAGAYSAAYGFEHPLISVLKDYVIVSYEKNNDIGIYRKDISSANTGSTFKTITIPNQNNSTINDEVLWGSIITDKFYYDESNTWTYLNYFTYDTQTEGANIYYLVSYDQGKTWTTPVAIISQSAWAMRYAISTGYTTPEPYTGIDFLWFTWLSNDKDLYATKVDIYTVQADPSAATTNIKLIAETDTRNVWHGTVATYFDKIFITGMIYWETGSKTSSNKNADLYMTFSDDGGEKWGTEDYSWYYWKDVLDKQEWRPVATYGTNGVLGFSWTYDGDLYFRTNSTGEYLQGWNPSVASDVNSSGTIFMATAIKDSTFHYAYSPWGDPTDVFYNNKNMEAAQKSNLSGYVTNALDGKPISNATVNITDLTATTDQSGYFQIKSIKPGYVNADFASNTQLGSIPLDVQFINLTSDGSQAITISASDFISYDGMIKLSPGKDHSFEYSLTPQLASGEIRAVLNWGAVPDDLDGHLFTPEIFGKEYHVWWYEPGANRSAPFATLDHDDTLSYGPETITISQTFSGTYSYYVTNYSREYDATQSNFYDAEATVSIYDDKGKVATIGVPNGSQSSDYNHWKVFTMDGSTGDISLVNELTNSRPDLTSGKIQADDFKKSTINKSISFNNRRGKTSIDLYYSWDFGDGNTSAEEAPSHIYETPGKYTVKLESSDGANYSTKSISDYIVVVSNMPPTVKSLDTIKVALRSTISIDMDTVFTDPDNDKLSYKVISSNIHVASAEISNNLLHIKGLWPMECTLIIDADDGNDGKVSISVPVEVGGGVLGVDQNSAHLPETFELWEAYPNPFNPTTTLRFDLPEVSDIILTIYNMLGQKVKTFNMQSTPAGYHSITWDATNDLNQQVGAGLYLYQLQTKDFVKTRKMVLLK